MFLAQVFLSPRKPTRCLPALLLLCGLCYSPVSLAQAVLLTDTSTNWDIGSSLDVLEDPSGLLTLDDVRRPDTAVRFARSGPGGLSYGFSNSAWWLRVRLVNTSLKADDWLLALAAPRLEDVTLYREAADGIRVTQTGLNHGYKSREVAHASFIFPLDLPVGVERTIWVRLHTEASPIFVPVQVWRTQVLAEADHTGSAMLGVFIGLSLAVLMYLLILQMMARKWRAVWLQVYVLGFVLAIMTEVGADLHWLWPSSPYLGKIATNIGQMLAILGCAAFTGQFIGLRLSHPRWNRAVLLAGTCAAVANGLGFFWHRWAIFADVLTPLAVAVALASCVGPALAGVRTARWLGVAWLLALVGYLIVTMQRFGWMPAHGDRLTQPVAGAMVGMAALVLTFADEQVQTLLRLARANAQRDKAEAVLLTERRDRIRQVLERAPDPTMLASAQGRILFANAAAHTLFGYAADELVGQPVEILIPEGQRNRHVMLREEHARSGKAQPMFQRPGLAARRRDGTTFLAQVDLVPYETEDGGALLVSVHDMTQQRAAEEALRQSEARYRSLADNLPGVVYQALPDAEHTLLYVSRAAEQIVHFDGSDPGPGGLQPRKMTHPDDWPVIVAQQTAAVTAGHAYQVEYRVRYRDGTLRSMLDTGVLRRDGPGGQPVVEGFVQDVTEKVAAQRDLAAAKEAAEVASQAKSAFLANMSHEIRTPMNAVLGFAEILARMMTDAQQRRYLDAIRTSGRALLSLINDVLDLSKIEAGKLDLQLGPVNLRAVMREVEQIFAQKCTEKGIRLEVEIDPGVPPSLVLDEVRLRQVLLNLVGNAVKFTDKGRVRLSVHSELLERLSAVDIKLAVSDTGMGIAAAQVERIFEAFEQQAGQSHARFGGTGLGLAITRRLIGVMGGTIHVESVLGDGSTFYVRLPGVAIAAGLAAGDAAQDGGKAWAFAPGTVVVVDDIAVNRELVAAYLDKTGLKVIEAANGSEGLAAIRAHRPTLVLSDIKMPEMDGNEMAGHLRDDPETSQIPIVVLTASTQMNSQVMRPGLYDGFLRKPVSRDELLAELGRHIPHTSQTVSRGKSSGAWALTPLTEVDSNAERLRELQQKFEDALPHWRELCRSRDLDGLEAFGNRAIRWGRDYGSPRLCDWGRTLVEQAANFDLDGMVETLDGLEDLMRDVAAPDDKTSENG